MGDAQEDVGCFEAVGHPIVSFLTPEVLKQKFAHEYRLLFPKTNLIWPDILKIFRDIIKKIPYNDK
jgi:hypothetical protein